MCLKFNLTTKFLYGVVAYNKKYKGVLDTSSSCHIYTKFG